MFLHVGLFCLTLVSTPSTPSRSHQIEAEDYFSLGQILDLAVAPGGKEVVWVENRWQEGLERRNADLWRQKPGGSPQRLSFQPKADHHPVYAKDGQTLYFLSTRPGFSGAAPYDGKRQVYRLSPSGQLTAVTHAKKGVSAFKLSRDNRRLVYLSGVEAPKKDAFSKLRKRYKKLEYAGSPRGKSQLFVLDLERWTTRAVGPSDRYIAEFDLSPDAKRVVMVTVPSSRLIDMEGWSKLSLLDLEKGTRWDLPDEAWRAKAPSPYGWMFSPGWSFDGQMVSVRVDFDGYPGETFVLGLGKAGTDGQPGVRFVKALPRLDESTASGAALWRPGHAQLCVQVVRQARDHVDCSLISKNGEIRRTQRLTRAYEGSVEGFAFDPTGKTLGIIMSGLQHPPDVFLLPATGASRYTRVTRVNPQVDGWKLPEIRRVQWKSSDGTPVEGILELPPDYKPGTRLPLLVELHGGPTSATRFAFRFWIYGRTLYAAKGYAMLSPNYRGSTGYGDRFLTDLIGHKNDRDLADILSGVDHLIEQGLVDPEKMALMGWSNGGYLTNALIAKTNRFKAASSGAGVVDTAMQWMLEDTPGHVVNFAEGLPWVNAEGMKKSSPLYGLKDAKTPTLIHVGENDERVPAAHSKALYRALSQYLKVPTELVIYPGEGHGLTTMEHRRAKMAWDWAWMEKWLMGKD